MRTICFFFLLAGVLYWASCNNQPPVPAKSSYKSEAADFPFFLQDKTMLINREQDNEIEGTYLKVTEVVNDSVLKINLPDDFYLQGKNLNDWMIGWPTGKAYYDAGCENLRELVNVDLNTQTITIGKLLRGNGAPVKNKRVVFWSRNPSGFKTSAGGRIIEPAWFKNFGGKSMEAGAIIYDSTRQQWIMYIQEVDTTHVQIYATTSPDLVKWTAYKNGQPLFTAKDFEKTTWAGTADDGKTPQTARMYNATFHNGQWFFFLSGYAKDGKRHIGTITAKDPLNGPFTIHEKPVLSPGNTYDAKACFYPKVCKAKDRYLLYYDGMDADGVERVCMAESKDLLQWQKYSNNPVLDKHYGWRNGLYTSEPNYVVSKGDSVWLMAGGYKKYNTEFTTEDSVQGRLPIDTSIFSASEAEKGKHISGNVMDAQLGVFLSVDGGHHFTAHRNNPVWVCNYSDTLQNDHSGGDFFPFLNNGKGVIIYQAKSETYPSRYNILLRSNE